MKTANPSEAYQTFLSSMQISYADWREGESYDLEALENISASERGAAVKLLAERLKTSPNWREIEALAAIGTPAAKEAMRDALKCGDAETRLRAAEELIEMGETADLDGVIIDALRKTDLSSGLSQAIDMAEQNPSPAIQEALLDLSLNGNEDQRVQCAALALYLGGKADEAFDWNHRPFFLRFGEPDRAVVVEAYRELCQRLRVAPKLK